MDSATYRSIIKQTILKYSQFRPSHGSIRLDPIFDDVHDRYGLMRQGIPADDIVLAFQPDQSVM